MPFPPPARPIQVVLADDHDLVRSGIKALLQLMQGIEVIAEARNGNELLQVLATLKPDVVLTDISMPGLDGIAALSHIRERHPHAKVVVLSMYDTVDFVKRAVAGGACGYVMKDAPAFELEQAVRTVAASGRYFSAGITQKLLQPGEAPADEELTERQLQILRLIAQGQSSKEIGFTLGLSSKTVDAHRARIMERLQLTDIASLTRYAVRKGLVKL